MTNQGSTSPGEYIPEPPGLRRQRNIEPKWTAPRVPDDI